MRNGLDIVIESKVRGRDGYGRDKLRIELVKLGLGMVSKGLISG